ncbi:MAG: glucose-1-phosphate adenylyltransferase [Chloroflexota bacterium]
MNDVLGLILGGGVGTRLYPLTRDRAKPAVPLAGKYRLIDIPMSSCFHAGIDKIAILTQFNSVSLHRHIYRTYTRDVFAKGWVQVLAAEQTPRSGDWYQGTADAVRKQMLEIRSAGTNYILILAGDHLYRMDYADFARFHEESGADITIAVQPVGREAASGLGILKLDAEGRISRFTEKPRTAEALDDLVSRNDPDKPLMASMGIYFFSLQVLEELLDLPGVDFGRDLIPAAIHSHRVMGYVFDGYWEDIGTIRRFYEVNLDMARKNPPFDFYVPDRPIYTHARFLPGSEVYGGLFENVLLADGCQVDQATIRHSVIGVRSIIESNVTINRTVIMGADYYETEKERAVNAQLGRPHIGIGAGSIIEGAIVDKNARIGRSVVIRALADRPDSEQENWVARDGIVIVPKNALIPDGTVI